MKVTLKSIAHDGTTIEVSSSSAVTLTEMLDLFKSFLLGSGYYVDGELAIVSDEPQEPEQHEEDPEFIARIADAPEDINSSSTTKITLTFNDNPAGMSYTGGSEL